MEESTDKRWQGLTESARDQLEIRDYSDKPALAGDYIDPDHPASIDIPGVEIFSNLLPPIGELDGELTRMLGFSLNLNCLPRNGPGRTHQFDRLGIVDS